jgi:acetyl esterase/lipase
LPYDAVVMQPPDVLTRPARQPDLTLSYGALDDHVADLWLPSAGPADGAAGWPLIVFLRGGFWRAAYDRSHAGPLAEALAADGLAVCAPEYRRVGQPGGGWPGTFDDIRSALGILPRLASLATDGHVDGRRVVLAGHSAGGHLALWACQLQECSPGAVISLAGVCDLAEGWRLRLGNGAAGELMGGGPADFPDRYAAADPAGLLPRGLDISLVHGQADDRVPWELSRSYGERAAAAGNQVRCVLLPGVGHFELIDPLSGAWPAVRAEFAAAAGGLEPVG